MLFIGMVIGAFITLFVLALCKVAGEADETKERMVKK